MLAGCGSALYADGRKDSPDHGKDREGAPKE